MYTMGLGIFSPADDSHPLVLKRTVGIIICLIVIRK